MTQEKREWVRKNLVRNSFFIPPPQESFVTLLFVKANEE